MDGPGPLGDFLQARRAQLRPEDIGLPAFGPRRVAGLRREELAQLAGVSASYCTRLEQGLSRGASPEVLDAVARALQLSDHERDHLDPLAPHTPAHRPNMSRMLFLDPHSRELYQDWNRKARAVVGNLRTVAGRHPEDQLLAELIGELTMKSPDFVALALLRQASSISRQAGPNAYHRARQTQDASGRRTSIH
ncbi:transcriptional regulator with XRE-family HTH domain [Catenulispora sp. GAS73]